MQIKFFCPHWGLEQISLEQAFRQMKEAGYDGVEMAVPSDQKEKEEFVHLLDKYQLELIAQQWSAAGNSFAAYKDSFEKQLYYMASVKPLFINSQTGKDHYTFEQNCELIQKASQIQKETGVTILHETHRGKFSFCAAITRKFLEVIPDFAITADFSHWCNVSESFLHDQQETVQLAISRAEHIHARVGHTQAAQVNDPRAPEWQEALQQHLFWWDSIIKRHKSVHTSAFTITPEFGPWPYMPNIPFTKQPIAHQWEINLYMKDLLKSRYSEY